MRAEQASIRFRLRPTPPFRLDWTVWALRRRAMNAIDRWDGATYRRAVTLSGAPVLLTISQHRGLLDVVVTGKNLPGDIRRSATNAIERLLGIRLDLSAFYDVSASHARLHELAASFRGMKPPRFETVFEGLVNGIACQQLSLTVGIILLNRMTGRYGRLASDGVRAFPRAQALAGAKPEDLRKMGFSGNKTRTLIDLSQSIADGRLGLDGLSRLDNAECVRRLVAIKGIGRWTAEYALLRSLGRIDVFPGDDVGGQNSLTRWLHLRKKLDYRRVQKKLWNWRSYGGLIFLHLLLKGLSDSGVMTAENVSNSSLDTSIQLA